jgi:uncharacterized protein YbcI
MSASDDRLLTASAESRGGMLLQVSNAMVRVYKEQFGRGPTTARSYWSGPDMLTSVLEDTLTPPERNLVAMNEHERLRDSRIFFQYAALREFCEPIEEITGRRIRAFVSGIDTHVGGLSIETFVLHPVGYDGASRIELSSNGRAPRSALGMHRT